MGTEKRERQKAGRQARVEAAQHAQKRAENRRRIALGIGLVVFVAAAIGLAAFLTRDDDKSTDTASQPTDDASLEAPSGESAAGKPCVAVSEPLPEGAPEVPIVEGPPSAELVIEDLVVGEGEAVTADSTVTVHYIGVSCSTGAVFDSSWSRGESISFPLSGVIPGWTEGMVGMQPGGQRLLIIPPDMAYGDSPGSPKIAPGETLYFVIDLESSTPGGVVPSLPDPAITADASTTTVTP